MYKALYRAYRPETFEEVLGQDHIIRILMNQLRAGEVNHAYLFCGTRGTGKTTVARLLAKAVNCLEYDDRPCGHCANCEAIRQGSFMDLIELDAASNNHVDDIRELRESVNYPPVAGRKKIYILDEVHMLSKSAFNALLKTLEEPPENVMFILCTTEPEKLPPTVLSRCIRMDFRRVSEAELLTRMQEICSDRGVSVDDSGLRLIAAKADGSARDGLSILEQCISGRNDTVSREEILETLGSAGDDFFIELTNNAEFADIAQGLVQIEEMMNKGRDPRQIMQGWLEHYRNLLMVKFVKNPEDIISMSMENIERIKGQSEDIPVSEINEAIREISRALYDARRSSQPRVLLEMTFIKLASGDNLEDGRQRPVRKAEVKKASHAQKRAENIRNDDKGDAAPLTQTQDTGADEGMGLKDESTKDVFAEPKRPPIAERRIIPREEEKKEPVPYDKTGTEHNEMQKAADEPQESSAAQSDYDLDRLWIAFLDEGEREIGGNMNLVKEMAIPLEFSGSTLKIQGAGIVYDIIERYSSQLAKALSKVAGDGCKLDIVSDDAEQESEQTSFEDTLARASKILGVEVKAE